jgi:hypothetical protein
MLPPMEGWRSVVLVEGTSDEAALHALAERMGIDLNAHRVGVVAMGGATNIGRHLERFGPHGDDLQLAGLCDIGEVRAFRRALERAGVGPAGSIEEMEQLGFFVCDADLEDELIRTLGADRVEQVIHAAGETTIWRTFQRQPAQRGRTDLQQLRRFMGTKSGRKIRYGRLLVEALDLTAVPRPLAGVVERALAGSPRHP